MPKAHRGNSLAPKHMAQVLARPKQKHKL